MKKTVFICLGVILFAKNVEVSVEKIVPVYEETQNGECKLGKDMQISPFLGPKNDKTSQNCEIKSKKILVGYKNIAHFNGKEYYEISQKPLSKITIEY